MNKMKSHFIKIGFLVAILISLFSQTTMGQHTYLSGEAGVAEVFVKDGFTYNNFGSNLGVGIIYTFKDSLFGLQVKAIYFSVHTSHYNDNSVMFPLLFRINPIGVDNFHFELGPYFQVFTPNDLGKMQDWGATFGVNYLKSISAHIMIGGDLNFMYGVNQPVAQYEPVYVDVNGIPQKTTSRAKESFNIQSFLLNIQLCYRIK